MNDEQTFNSDSFARSGTIACLESSPTLSRFFGRWIDRAAVARTVLCQTHAIDAQRSNERRGGRPKSSGSRGLFAKERSPERPAVIDGGFLGALEPLLDDYFSTVVFSLMGRDPTLDAQQNELRARIQTEALFVRGLGYANEIEGLAVELYSPHEAWCVTNLGLRVQDAFEVARIIGEGLSNKIADLRARSREIEKEVEYNPESVTHHREGLPCDSRLLKMAL